MRKIFKSLLVCSILAFAANASFAQINLASASGDLKLRIMGRTNLDAGIFLGEDGDDTDGVVMNDTRLGVQASFDEKYSAKIEVCFAQKAISFRDLWIGYKIDDAKSLKFGHFFMPYGSKILGLAYKFVEDSPVDYTFCPSRKIGAAYDYTTDFMKFTAGIFSDGSVDAKGTNQGYNLSAKMILRPTLTDEKVFHVGFAPMFTKSHNAVTVKGIVPVTFASANLVSSKALDAKNQFRYEGEVIYINKRFLWETHILGTSINVRGVDDNYTSWGGFTQFSWHLIGTQQKYNKAGGIVANAPAKTLELLLRADYLNLENDLAEFDNGNQFDITLGLNYFFSKYLNLKFNYVYAKNNDDKHYNGVQGRLQFSF